ncbi:MAG: glutathione S-transferase [Gammaproteobacteria bacterium]|nr:glutathione S-transferase [Gammaproteobacteria bacterium]MBU1442987.1 glutathione S-transferase [Gammaproteobacteria bacterium]MBU2285429.1 glutathione S-transferase [Gammaproteobacteria bacterium]MBU2411025.1 glutathione S-transferase [Gammaproteobacteria bacterium]
MLTLIGFAASNYYNKVRLALLEKQVTFDEELAWVGETDLSASPLGKVPYLRTDAGTLCESAAINEYIEAAYPQNPLLPAEPFAAAKVRELVLYLELHLELVARNVYAEAFFGGKVSDGTKTKTAKALEKNLPAFAKLARFDSPFIAGDMFTLADCAAICHLPVVGNATQAIYGRNMVAELVPEARDYLKRMGERPCVKKMNADRKINTEAMLERYR